MFNFGVKNVLPTKASSFGFGVKKDTAPSVPIQPAKPVIVTHKFSDSLGGGVYNSVKGEPNTLVNTGHSTYGGEQTKAGQQRDDIFPVGLGGVNSDKRNIRYEPLNKSGETDTDQIEKQAINDYKAGKISLPEARLQVITAKQRQVDKLDTDPYSFNNLWNGLKDTVKSGGQILNKAVSKSKDYVASLANEQDKKAFDLLKKGAGALVPNEEQLKAEYEKAKPTFIKGREVPQRMTSIGLITKQGDRYSGIDLLGGVGSMEDVSKKPIKGLLSKAKGVIEDIITNPSETKIAAELGKTEKPLLKSTVQEPLKVPEAPKLSQKGISYQDLTPKAEKGQVFPKKTDVELNDVLPKQDVINTKNLNISDKAKAVINDSIAEVKPMIEKKIGSKLTNKEVIDLADNSSRTLNSAVGQEQTKQWEAALLKTRQKLAAMAESGTVDKEYLDTLATIKSQGADIGRKLQSFSIGADPKNVTSKQVILEQVLKITDDTDKILNAAKGVDFNDAKQAAKFYREFIKPKASEWIDLVRYNSMLSSPNTHINNTFVNLLNTNLIAPIEKSLTGGIDFIGSKLTGSQRKAFAGEGVKYLEGYISHLKDATTRFSDVMSGRSAATNLDTKNIPFAVDGAKGKVADFLSYPMKLLEASDQFFSSLAEGGEKAALTYRQGKGVAVRNLEQKAKDDAAYRLFRQDLFSKDQGHVLDAVDQLTNKIDSLRNSKNPIVSTIAKFTVPFVKTPMNIFKQGIEYSPAGLTTLWGAGNKTEQLSKTLIGSSVFAGAATLLTSDRLTWSEPADEEQKNLWREAGRQSYSVKIGDTWVSYQKLPPAIAFPFAMVSSLSDLQKNKKIDDDSVDLTLKAIAKYGQFLADQSYAKSIGDLLSIPKGGESAISKFVSNYPQQLIPYRAFSGWLARMLDESQRKVDSKADFIDKQMQLLMMNIPGLSQKVPARVNDKGEPIKSQNRVANSFLPFRTSKEDPKLTNFLSDYEALKQDTNRSKQIKANQKESFKPVYDEIRKLVSDGNTEQAQKKLEALSDADYKLYKEFKKADKTAGSKEVKVDIYNTYNEVQNLIKEGKTEEAQSIVDNMTDEEYKAYKSLKNSIRK